MRILSFFISVALLLYDSTAWTLTKRLQRTSEGCYGLHWIYPGNSTRHKGSSIVIYFEYHKSFERLEQDLWVISEKSQNELICDIPLWTPKHWGTSSGHLYKTYIYQIYEDTKYQTEDLWSTMGIVKTEAKESWRLVQSPRPDNNNDDDDEVDKIQFFRIRHNPEEGRIRYYLKHYFQTTKTRTLIRIIQKVTIVRRAVNFKLFFKIFFLCNFIINIFHVNEKGL